MQNEHQCMSMPSLKLKYLSLAPHSTVQPLIRKDELSSTQLNPRPSTRNNYSIHSVSSTRHAGFQILVAQLPEAVWKTLSEEDNFRLPCTTQGVGVLRLELWVPNMGPLEETFRKSKVNSRYIWMPGFSPCQYMGCT